MSVTIKFRRGNSAEWTSSGSTILASGEPGYEVDTGRIKIGNGITPWSGLYYSSVVPTGLIAGSGISINLGSNGASATISVSGLNSSYITNFNSSVSGLLPVKNIIGGSGINVSSLSGTYTVAVTGIAGLIGEEVDDRVAQLLVEGTGVNLTYNDASGTLTIDNLHTEINVLSQEPQGFINRTDSIISFNDSTRTFTIQPAVASGQYDIYVKGIKVAKTGVETVVIGTGTALNFLHFSTTAPYQLQTKTTFFDFVDDVPIAYIHWNSSINQSTFFGEERHGIRMDTATHKWIHNTFGMQYINGLSIGYSGLQLNGSLDSHAQISLSDGVLYQEDIIINVTDDNGSNSATEFVQPLNPIAYIPVYYHSGTTGQWVRDSGIPFPLKYNGTRPFYNLYDPGPPANWTVVNVDDNKYFAMWLVATNDINDPILAIMGQTQHSSLGSAENNNIWSDINLTNIPVFEFKPLYRLIFRADNAYTNTPKATLQSVLDLRASVITTVQGVTQNDHGSLFGLGDDDHNQYVHIDTARTITAIHSFNNGLVSSGLITSTSGNFGSLSVNGTGVSVSGHTHSSSDITDFNSSVSGLVSGIYQPLLNNPVTGTGTSGYLSKFTASNTIDNSIIYESGGNVGISHNTPGFPLDVSGVIRSSSFIAAATDFRLNNSAFSRVGHVDSNGGFVGGYNAYMSGLTPLHNSSGSLSACHYFSDGSIRFLTNSGQAANTIASEKIRINNSGNMGIGTTLPLQKLDIRGNVYTSGNIGINTPSPTGALHVVGTGLFSSVTGVPANALLSVYSTVSGATVFNVEGTNGSLFSVVDNLSGSLMSVNNNAGLPVFEVFSNDSVIAGRFGQNDWVVSSGGNVGIGTGVPSFKLHVVGTGNFTQNVLVNGTGVSISGHTHTASSITDFNEAVDDRIGSGLFVAGTGINLNYNDGSNSFTVSVTGLIANPSGNRILTSRDSTTTGIDAESNLTFDGQGLTLDVSEDSFGNIIFKQASSVRLVIDHDDDDNESSIIAYDYPLYVASFSDALQLSGPTSNYISLNASSGIDIGAPSGITAYNNFKINNQTANTIASFDANKNVVSLSTGTYPSLTELSYVKGVTSAIQTQINGKQNTLTNPVTGTGIASHVAYWNSSSGIVADSGQLFWDATNNRLGLGTGSPTYGLHLVGSGYVNGFLDIDNLRLDNNTLSSTSGSIIINPSGNGALQRDSGGSARGQYAVDWQTTRTSVGRVASANYSVIGGGQNNMANATHTVVCGGYNNNASANYSTVCGGASNSISNVSCTYSTIGGGIGNSISSPSSAYSIIGGGQNNSVDGDLNANATICGGYANSIGGYYCNNSTIGGGYSNFIGGNYVRYTTIAGGYNNNINGDNGSSSTIGGGGNNNITGDTNSAYSTIAGGSNNYIEDSIYSTIGGGFNNNITGTNSAYSTIPGGREAKTTKHGELSHAAGFFASVGDAQHTTLIARRSTSSATANVVLFLDASSKRLTIPAKTTWTFEVKLSAYNDTDSAGAGWIFRGAIRRNGANGTALIGTVITESWQDSAMTSTSASVVADDTNEALEIRVTGLASKNIRWVAVVDISQVSYGAI